MFAAIMELTRLQGGNIYIFIVSASAWNNQTFIESNTELVGH